MCTRQCVSTSDVYCPELIQYGDLCPVQRTSLAFAQFGNTANIARPESAPARSRYALPVPADSLARQIPIGAVVLRDMSSHPKLWWAAEIRSRKSRSASIVSFFSQIRPKPASWKRSKLFIRKSRGSAHADKSVSSTRRTKYSGNTVDERSRRRRARPWLGGYAAETRSGAREF